MKQGEYNRWANKIKAKVRQRLHFFDLLERPCSGFTGSLLQAAIIVTIISLFITLSRSRGADDRAGPGFFDALITFSPDASQRLSPAVADSEHNGPGAEHNTNLQIEGRGRPTVAPSPDTFAETDRADGGYGHGAAARALEQILDTECVPEGTR